MHAGKVAIFDPSKGWGFVEHDDGRTLFFHYTDAIGKRRDFLTGDPVVFNVEERARGPHAVDVMFTPPPATHSGSVAQWNEANRWGFIYREGGPDVFVRQEEIRVGHRRGGLKPGEIVDFSIKETPKGPHAVHVRRRVRTPRQTGTVVWFNDAKGCGLIRSDDGAEAFAHFSAIVGTEHRRLVARELVYFEVQEMGDKSHAINIRRRDLVVAEAMPAPPGGVEVTWVRRTPSQ